MNTFSEFALWLITFIVIFLSGYLIAQAQEPPEASLGGTVATSVGCQYERDIREAAAISTAEGFEGFVAFVQEEGNSCLFFAQEVSSVIIGVVLDIETPNGYVIRWVKVKAQRIEFYTYIKVKERTQPASGLRI